MEGLIPDDILDVHIFERNPFPSNMADDIIPLAYTIDIDVLPQPPQDENAQQGQPEQGKL